jgi:hypothetical protein
MEVTIFVVLIVVFVFRAAIVRNLVAGKMNKRERESEL